MTNPQMWPAPYVPQPVPVARQRSTTAKVMRGILLPLGWLIQYGLFVPSVLGCRLMLGAFKLGMVGIIWLCVPVVGWVILAVMLLGHPAPHRSNIWRPWGIGRR